MPPVTPVVMFATASFNMNDRREGNVVYAPRMVRYHVSHDGPGPSVPVGIGQWLFENALLTHHSFDRTARGNRWAHQVGGVLPDLAPEGDPRRGTPEATDRRSVRIYDALCDWRVPVNETMRSVMKKHPLPPLGV